MYSHWADYYRDYKAHEHPASTLFHRYVSKNGAALATFLFVRLRVHPNIISLGSFFAIAVAGIILVKSTAAASPLWFLALTQLSYILDCTDGVVARMASKQSKFGAFLDLTLDRINHFVFFVSVGLFCFREPMSSPKEVYVYLGGVILYVVYSINMTVLTSVFPELKGAYARANREKRQGLLRVGVRILYEWIDTGIMYCMFALAVIFSLVVPVAAFYGTIGLALTMGGYAYAWKVSKTT